MHSLDAIVYKILAYVDTASWDRVAIRNEKKMQTNCKNGDKMRRNQSSTYAKIDNEINDEINDDDRAYVDTKLCYKIPKEKKNLRLQKMKHKITNLFMNRQRNFKYSFIYDSEHYDILR